MHLVSLLNFDVLFKRPHMFMQFYVFLFKMGVNCFRDIFFFSLCPFSASSFFFTFKNQDES